MTSRAALLVAAAVVLSGCSSLPFGSKGARDEPPAEPLVPIYTFSVEAPGERVAALLETHLDLARFQRVPASENVTPVEIDRLAAATPAQARSILETEGWFEAEVTVVQTPPAAAGALPHVAVVVVPGRRVRVADVSLTTTAPLAPRHADRDLDPAAAGEDRLERLRQTFPLRSGDPFRQDAWAGAKNAALASVRGDAHAAATWQDTRATVDVDTASARLALVLEPGPVYRLGPIRVEGLQRYDAEAVRRLATFFPGATYSEALLFDFQERLLKVGLFGGASVEMDPETADPAAAPVTVRVRELTLQQATVGVGYSADTGPRFSLEHVDRRVFGQRWIARSRLEVGPEIRSIGTALTSYPLANLYRNVASANVEQLLTTDEQRNAWSLRAGRAKDDGRFERTGFVEVSHARVANDRLATSGRAVAGNYHWLLRDVDDILLPTRGRTIAAQGALGYGAGRERIEATGATSESRGPFTRAYARLSMWRPFGGWYGQARVEAGEVFAKNRIGVPDPLLFRAGGDDSIRGYDYRTLGPEVAGQVVSGRVLLTGSAEIARPFIAGLPNLWAAAFVDGGNAADRWKDWRPVFGVGVGLRYRSPVGPLKLDVAYGEATKQFRLHFAAGVAF